MLLCSSAVVVSTVIVHTSGWMVDIDRGICHAMVDMVDDFSHVYRLFPPNIGTARRSIVYVFIDIRTVHF